MVLYVLRSNTKLPVSAENTGTKFTKKAEKNVNKTIFGGYKLLHDSQKVPSDEMFWKFSVRNRSLKVGC